MQLISIKMRYEIQCENFNKNVQIMKVYNNTLFDGHENFFFSTMCNTAQKNV